MLKIIAIPADVGKETLHFSDEKACMEYFHISRRKLTDLLDDHLNDEVNGYFLDKEIIQERKKRKGDRSKYYK